MKNIGLFISLILMLACNGNSSKQNSLSQTAALPPTNVEANGSNTHAVVEQKMGSLNVNSYPMAGVSLYSQELYKGRYIGLTPCVSNEIKYDKYDVVIELSGFKTVRKSVVFSAEEPTVTINVKLEPEVGTFVIGSVEDLIEFRNMVNRGESPKVAALIQDLDLKDQKWIPIGSQEYPFNGTFEGNSYDICNLCIDSELYAQGLFGVVKGGCVNNFYLENPQIKNYGYTGGICGMVYSGSISACGIKGGTITVEDSEIIVTGGVVGTAVFSQIGYCYNTASISVQNTSNEMGTIAGVVGMSSESTIYSCYNTGSIKVDNKSNEVVAGIVGVTEKTTVGACYNTGAISGDNKILIGGVIAMAGKQKSSNTISACYNIGSLSSEDSYSVVGGIAGVADEAVIEHCYNIGVVVGGEKSGAIVGMSESAVSNCYYYPSNDAYTNNFGTYSDTLVETMKSEDFILTISGPASWINDSEFEYDKDNINNGYPLIR